MKIFLVLLALLAVTGATAFSLNGTASVSIENSTGVLLVPGNSTAFNITGNDTVSLPFSLSQSFNNISFSLASGEVRNVSGLYDTISLTCSGAAGPVCGVSQTLGSGESVNVDSTACNVHVSCANATVLANGTICPVNVNINSTTYCTQLGYYDNQTLNITTSISVIKNGDSVTIALLNDSRTIDLRILNASTNFDLSYVCPLTLQNISDQAQAEDVFNVCTNYFPQMMGFFNLTLNKCFNNFDDYKEYVAAHEATVQAANQELANCKADNGLKEGTINTLNSETARLQQTIQSDGDERQVLVAAAFMLGIAWLITAIVAFAMWHRADTRG